MRLRYDAFMLKYKTHRKILDTRILRRVSYAIIFTTLALNYSAVVTAVMCGLTPSYQ